MVKLAKSTYEKVRQAIEQSRLCSEEHYSSECVICRCLTREALREVEVEFLWCLCEYHQREIGVLW